jgi:hypothetical protein
MSAAGLIGVRIDVTRSYRAAVLRAECAPIERIRADSPRFDSYALKRKLE